MESVLSVLARALSALSELFSVHYWGEWECLRSLWSNWSILTPFNVLSFLRLNDFFFLTGFLFCNLMVFFLIGKCMIMGIPELRVVFLGISTLANNFVLVEKKSPGVVTEPPSLGL